MCSQCVRVFECVIDVNRPQSASAIVAPSYIVSRLKASWHVRNPHKKLQKSLEHQTTVFFFSFHASFTFILGFYGGFLEIFSGCLATNIGKFDKPEDWVRAAHWQMKLATARGGGTHSHTHTWAQQKLTANKTRWIDFQVKVMLGFYNAPLPSVAPSYLPKNSAQIARCVCANWMCQNLLLTCKRKRERKWVREWAKSLYS